MKKKKSFLLACLIIVLVGIVYKNASLKNTKEISKEDIEIVTLDLIETIELPNIDFQKNGFTCTGLTYDKNHDTFWVGNYGKLSSEDEETTPSLVQLSSDFKTVISQISIRDDDADIQGVSYDNVTDTLWYSNGYSVNNCDLEGNVIKTISLGKYEKFKPNGILYDNNSNSVWILCFYHYLLNYSVEGELIKCYKSDYVGQDHLCMDSDGNIYFSSGVDYSGDDNFVVCYRNDMTGPINAYRVLGSYAIEGICILEDYLYVANDGYYHNAYDNRNVIVKYFLK